MKMIARIDESKKVKVTVHLLDGPLANRVMVVSIPKKLMFLKRYTFYYQGLTYVCDVRANGKRSARVLSRKK